MSTHNSSTNHKKHTIRGFLSLFILFSACVTANEEGQQTMNTEKSCTITPLEKSQNYIRAILDDISTSYTHVGGGGITGIKLLATDTFMVSIAQEERIDQITYELEITDACKVNILNKTIGAKTPWEER